MNVLRNSTYRAAVAASIAAIGVVGLVACGGGSGGSSAVQIVVPPDVTPSFTTKGAVLAVDAATGETVSDVLFSFAGDDAANVVDGLGGALVTISSGVAGTASFNIKSTRTPSETSPLDLSVIASKSGYIASSVALNATAPGELAELVRLVKLDPAAAPEGVQVAPPVSASTTGGAVVSAAVVESSSSSTGVGGGKIEIPASTVVRRSDGTAAVGDISVNSVFFTSAGESSLSAFPGGFSVAVNEGSGATSTPDEGMFVSGGFAAFEVKDSAGLPITNFDSPITLTIEVPADTINPLTNTVIAESDQFPIWSYDEVTGRWEEHTLTVSGVESVERGTVVGKAANGNFNVQFRTDHLSYYNVDYFFGRQNVCNPKISFTGLNQQVKVKLSRADTGQGFYKDFAVNPSQPFLELARVASSVNYKISVLVGSTVVNETLTSSICSNPTIQLTNLPAPPAPSSISLSVTEKCQDGSNQRGVSTYVSVYSPSNGASFSGVTNSSGAFSFANLLPATYFVYVENNRNFSDYFYESRVLAAGQNLSIPVARTVQCTVVTGTGGGG